MDSEDGGHDLAGLARGQDADGLPAAAFQFLRNSKGSAHDTAAAGRATVVRRTENDQPTGTGSG